ncbi:MAG: methyltransferase domain-containing protein [Gammaproteobacteria bacterium]|nr:MAG: methyltransferase domain-containing protein [Gammaproteobacteria bacterium]
MQHALLKSEPSEPLPDASELAAYCKAAGDGLRLEILRVLRQNAYGVLELSQIFDIGQSGMSHHLKVLAKSGLVATRREGNSIFYRRAPAVEGTGGRDFQLALFSAVDQLCIPSAIQQRIQQVHRERTEASQDFFRQNAARFHANQDLIASFDQYGEPATELMDATPVSRQHVLEVGPGEGGFLPALASRFKQVTALDNSAEMLDRARQLVNEQQLDNVKLLHGDTELALSQGLSADCITLNMVLHHTPDPAKIFSDLALLLKPGGALLVTELCHHDQSWARESCGDQWLGFDPEDLSYWANAAGLHEGESLFLAQRNGFQIQLRQFFKPTVAADTGR